MQGVRDRLNPFPALLALVTRVPARHPFPTLVLRSPLHRLISRHFLLLTFAGRKSGRTITTPVAYVREDDTLLLTTVRPWWRNFEAGGPVGVTLAGRDVDGTAEAITDEEAVADGLERMIDRWRPNARLAGIPLARDGRADREELLKTARAGRVVVRVELGPDAQTP